MPAAPGSRPRSASITAPPMPPEHPAKRSSRCSFSPGPWSPAAKTSAGPSSSASKAATTTPCPGSRSRSLEPPAVRSLTVAVVPPAYSGWPAVKLGAGASLRVLAGSRLRVAGQSSTPLRSASICVEGGRELPAVVNADGLHFTLGDQLAAGGQHSLRYQGTEYARTRPSPLATRPSPLAPHPLPPAAGLLVEKSSAYWLKLIDTNGLEGGSESRWELQAVPQEPPGVVIERPAGTVFVTPRAVVPLRAWPAATWR